jgi:hypothetical protein
VNKVMNLQVAENFGKFLSSCATCGFSSRAQMQLITRPMTFRLKNVPMKLTAIRITIRKFRTCYSKQELENLG